MDQETKDYLDAKFASIEENKQRETEQAAFAVMTHWKRMKRIAYACAAVLVLLAAAEIRLLYWAQFSSR